MHNGAQGEGWGGGGRTVNSAPFGHTQDCWPMVCVGVAVGGGGTGTTTWVLGP